MKVMGLLFYTLLTIPELSTSHSLFSGAPHTRLLPELDARGMELQSNLEKVEDILKSDDPTRTVEGYNRHSIKVGGINLEVFSKLKPTEIATLIRNNGQNIFYNDGVTKVLSQDQIQKLINTASSSSTATNQLPSTPTQIPVLPTKLFTHLPTTMPISIPVGKSQVGPIASQQIPTRLPETSPPTRPPATQLPTQAPGALMSSQLPLQTPGTSMPIQTPGTSMPIQAPKTRIPTQLPNPGPSQLPSPPPIQYGTRLPTQHPSTSMPQKVGTTGLPMAGLQASNSFTSIPQIVPAPPIFTSIPPGSPGTSAPVAPTRLPPVVTPTPTQLPPVLSRLPSTSTPPAGTLASRLPTSLPPSPNTRIPTASPVFPPSITQSIMPAATSIPQQAYGNVPPAAPGTRIPTMMPSGHNPASTYMPMPSRLPTSMGGNIGHGSEGDVAQYDPNVSSSTSMPGQM